MKLTVPEQKHEIVTRLADVWHGRCNHLLSGTPEWVLQDGTRVCNTSEAIEQLIEQGVIDVTGLGLHTRLSLRET